MKNPNLYATRWSEMRAFAFTQPNIQLPKLSALHLLWANVPDEAVRSAVCAQYQYGLFHNEILDNLTHRNPARPGSPGERLGLTVRAGALTALALLVGSITEAVLLAHARARRLPGKKKSLLDVIQAFRQGASGDLKELLDLADRVRVLRNDVHLYHGIHAARDFRAVLAEESRNRADMNRLLLLLQERKTP